MRMEKLRRLEFEHMTNADVSSLAAIASLRQLVLKGPDRSFDPSTLSKLQQLTHLVITGAHLPSLESVGRLRNLRGLHLWDCSFPDDLQPLRRLTNLQQLELDGLWYHDLSPIQDLSKLESLVLYGRVSLQPIRKIRNLRRLQLRNGDHNLSDLGGFQVSGVY